MALDMTIGELNDIAGVMCFSSTWKNPVMWSHYADQHRGICLGFEVPDVYRKKIKYVARRQPFRHSKAHPGKPHSRQWTDCCLRSFAIGAMRVNQDIVKLDKRRKKTGCISRNGTTR